MPYIKTNVSVSVTKEQEESVKNRLGQIITQIPGKSEEFLMIELEDNCRLYFGGNQDGPTAYVKVEVFGSLSDEYSLMLTKDICVMMEEELQIPRNRVYVNYESFTQWGWNGKNF